MAKWFKTENHQIFDLNNITSFWIEKTDIYRIFCEDQKECHWNIAEFQNEQDANEYIKKIYGLLDYVSL